MGIKISELQEKTTANDTDVIPIVDDGTKKITKLNFLKEIINKINGTTLYDNEAGTNANTINLSESCANYKYVEIEYKLVSSSVTYYSTNKVYEANNKEVALNIITTSPGGGNTIIGTELIAFNENIATTRRNYTYTGTDRATEEMYITKIIGFN